MPIVDLSIPEFVPNEILEALSEESVQVVLADIAAAARNHWVGLAAKELHSSRGDYMRSITEVQLMPGVAVIALVGQPANLIENGSRIVDLRDWLLGARVPEGERGKKRTKDGTGFYRSIPLRHQTPDTAGTQAPVMGDPYSGTMKAAKAMGREIYKRAQRLDATRAVVMGTSQSFGESAVRRKTQWGGRLPAGLAPKLREHHKTDIYAGMVKVVGAYESTTDPTYMTFRTISTRVPEGWIRPPTQGKHFAKRTAEFVAKIAPQAFQAYVDSATGGGG